MAAAPNILISGGGIAGSVFASCLLRAYRNASITIVERAPSPRLTGASVDIRNSAVDIIKWMGVEEEIRRQGTNEAGVQFIRADGSLIGTFEATGRTDVQSLTSEYEIFRGALAKIFLDPIEDRVTMMFDETVERFSQLDDGVEVTFAKSQRTEKYDLLVAADGLSSKLRGMMLQRPSQEQIFDEGVYTAYFTIKDDLLKNRYAKWYSAPGGRAIFLRPDRQHTGVTRGGLMNVRWRSDTQTKDRFSKAMAQGSEAYMKLMAEDFRDAGWLAPEVLKGMQESDDFYCSLFAQTRCPTYHNGRVVLLGDAAHALPGFGTSLAIMGAYALAGELLRHPSDIGAALRAYEDLMLPYVESQQGNDIAMQMMNPQTWWAISIRNFVIATITTLKLDKSVISASVWLGLQEKNLSLPQYPWPAETSA